MDVNVAGRGALVAIAAALLLACSSSNAQPAASSTSTPSSTSTTIAGPPPRCSLVDLKVAANAAAHAPTGHAPVLYVVTNLGAAPCALEGYPRLALRDAAGADLPFTVANHGGAVVTDAAPRPLTLGVEESAAFLLDKPDCAQPAGAVATTASIILADAPLINLLSTLPRPFELCADGDAGNTIDVSPFVANPDETLAS